MRCSKSRDGFCYRPFDLDIRWSGTGIVVDEARDRFSNGPRNVLYHPPVGAVPDDFMGRFEFSMIPSAWFRGHRRMTGLPPVEEIQDI